MYVFGDECRAPLVGLVAANGRAVQRRDLGASVSQLTTFGEAPNGDLYAVSRGGTIFRLTAS